MVKYIFITGGVISSLGKGILAASLGRLLKERGFRVTVLKMDPYLNVDPGTMNPIEHGECYVTRDGAETDLDLGHYERFLETETSQLNNFTAGKIFWDVINKERSGNAELSYRGVTFQVVPHVTNEIKLNIRKLADTELYDIILVELGGTVGDIESLPFLEAVRQFIWEEGKENALCIHLALLPYLNASHEIKTKPAQHSVKRLSEEGIAPDILVCRTERALNQETRQKLAMHCNVRKEAVIEARDVKSIYEVPKTLKRQKLDKTVLDILNLPYEDTPILEEWNDALEQRKNFTTEVNVGLVGKYVAVRDAYKSIAESLFHSELKIGIKVNVHYISTLDIEDEALFLENLKQMDALIVLPGFGTKGIEGKIRAVQFARENKVPFLGICLGMQLACVEFARNVLGLKDAKSLEVLEEDEKCENIIINLMRDKKGAEGIGGTLRKGAQECKIIKGTLAHSIYQKELISERHRHRYEFNTQYLDVFQKNGFEVSGIHPEKGLVEILELKGHPFFIGTQFHPEYESRFRAPHPIFCKLLEVTLALKENK